MEFSRVMDVLVICVPVFAVLGLGKLLGLKGKIKEEHCQFINWLVYTFSLPSLIFNEVAKQRFDMFLDPAVVVMPLIGLLIVVLLTMAIAKVNGFKGGFAASFVYGTYWANATYIGLPLCQNAFGSPGLAKAAIYNGFVLPFFILIGYLLIGFYGAGTGDQRMGARIKKAFLNPVLLSAVAGVGVALIAEQFRTEEGGLNLPMPVIASATLFGSFLKMIGGMGLPLALLSIGASLKWEQTRSHLGALSWSVGCKLLLTPLITLVLIRSFCPGASAVALGVTTILAGTPSAVAMYVISCQVGVERGFVSSMLVISTALSVITIPIWVYVVTGM
ncbi:AEC family transporter [Pontiellaceae bacterium B12227]|nr:AEC family transporter [Pontiellaceae bacterium B12227]